MPNIEEDIMGLDGNQRQILEDMKRRRDLLDKGITQLEYESTQPTYRSNMDEINAWVGRQIKEEGEHRKRWYQELLLKEKAGTLDHGEQGVLNTMKKEHRK